MNGMPQLSSDRYLKGNGHKNVLLFLFLLRRF